MNPVVVLPATLLFLSWTILPAVGHAEPPGPPARGNDSSGIVSGLNGHAAAAIPGSGASRELRIGDRVAAGEEIRVESGSSLELLWERRALFTLGERSRIALQESKNGSAFLQIVDGPIRIAYSYNEGHPTDTMKVQTPGTEMTLRGGIIEAAVEAAGVADRPRRTQFQQTGEAAGERLRVIEGQAYIEPRSSGAKPFLLKAGYEWQALPGVRGADAIRPSAGQGVHALAAAHIHHQVPAPTIQRVVRVHVEHALELERALSKPARDGNEPEETAGIKGAIVATSLGIPLTAITGAAAIAAASGVPAVPAGSIPGPGGPAGAPPAGVPPVVGPVVPTPVVPTPVVPTPVVPTPIIPTPGIAVLTPSQSGGINSLSILRDVLQDVSRGNGRRGRDRD